MVKFRESLFALNQVCTFNWSSLALQCDKQFGSLKNMIRIRVDRGWFPEGHRRSIHGCQIRTHQLSIVEYGSPNTTDTILINSQIYHKSQAEIKESRACSTVSNAFFLDLGNNRVDVPGIYI